MSAICGIYHRNLRPVLDETCTEMMTRLGIYHSDASGVLKNGSLFFGCHAQHITPESVTEILPFHDTRAGLTITADAIIDNRAELFGKLGINSDLCREMTDSRLILKAYEKWGTGCPRYLLGDFAFAIWDEKAQTLMCAVDHTGNRLFYYHLSSRLFAFSTLIEPLFTLPGIERRYNKAWIDDFLPVPPIKHAESLIYENILCLPAGYTLIVGAGTVVKQVYWKAERQTELRLKSDDAYEEAFREVLDEAVRCRLRSRKKVGVMMSGGLDSTSVACLAARHLAKEGVQLQAFTSLPMTGYRNILPSSRIADETAYVEAVCEYAGNIGVIYFRADGKHPLSETERLFGILEQPYKNFSNLVWIDAILTEARQRNMGVMLVGQSGNATISWGKIKPYARSLTRSGNWVRLVKEAEAFAARRKKSRLKTLLRFASCGLPEFIHKMEHHLRNYGEHPDDIFPAHVIRDSLGFRLFLLSPANFGAYALNRTKLGLAHNLIIRDPTADRRVVEFCLNVPDEQYIRNGRERFLIRRALTGVLPDKVRLNETIMGMQSADWPQRLQPHWPLLADEIYGIGALTEEQDFLDIRQIQRDFERVLRTEPYTAETVNLRRLTGSLIFSRFLKMRSHVKGGERNG